MTHVLLLATRDVIAYPDGEPRVTSRRGATLLGDLPGGSVTAAILVEDVLAEPSWDTSVATMLALVRRARTALTHDGFTGVVVTHGLDTIEETALLTDLVLGEAARHGNVPVTLFSTIQELTSWDIPAASRARTSASSLEDLTATDGLAAAIGAIGARGLPAAKAPYALMAALSTGGVSRCREWFSKL
jgi:L-asparaginase